jgi:succinoglycan biosynthesis protein ExoM
MNMKKIIVSIPTFRRPKRLQYLLESLQNQRAPEGFEVRILVVDNDCSGEVANVIGELSEPLIPIHLVLEDKRGIVHARNRIVKEFLLLDAKYLVFIDDDEWPARDDWIVQLVNAKYANEADIVTGPVIRISEDVKYSWVTKAMSNSLLEKQGVFQVKKFYTNNLLLTRKVVSYFDPPFDLTFNDGVTEDLHFSFRCLKNGFKAVCAPSAQLYELYYIDRLSLKWFFNRGLRCGAGATKVLLIEEGRSKIVYSLLFSLLRYLRSFGTLGSGVVMMDKGVFARGILQLGSALGSALAIVGMEFKEYRDCEN